MLNNTYLLAHVFGKFTKRFYSEVKTIFSESFKHEKGRPVLKEVMKAY